MKTNKVIKVGIDGSISFVDIPLNKLTDTYDYIPHYCDTELFIEDSKYQFIDDSPIIMYVKNSLTSARDLQINRFATNLFATMILGDVYLSCLYFDDKNLNETEKQEEYDRLFNEIENIKNDSEISEYMLDLNNLSRKFCEVPTITTTEELKFFLKSQCWDTQALRSCTPHDIELLDKNQRFLSKSFDYSTMSQEYLTKRNRYSYENLLNAYSNRKIKQFNGTVGFRISNYNNQRVLLSTYRNMVQQYPSSTYLVISGKCVKKIDEETCVLSYDGFFGAEILAKVCLR